MAENGGIDERRRAEGLISALGRSVGIEPLALDASNSVGLSFNDEMTTITYDGDTDSFVLFAIADRIPGPLGVEGMAGLMELNEELYLKHQASVLYNEMTLQVATLFRVGAWTLKDDSVLPWIDGCLETIAVIRERIWVLLGADRRKDSGDTDDTSFIRI